VEAIIVVSARGGKFGFVYTSRQKVYRKLTDKGMSKGKAARIANAGRTHVARSAMSRKGALHRKAHAHRTAHRR
jgi:hypothetical protein